MKLPKLSFDGLKRQMLVSKRILGIAWRLRKTALLLFFLGALLEIAGFILALYATAQLGALLAAFVTTGSTDMVWFWLWVDISCGLIIAMGFVLMGYAKRLLYFNIARWATNTYLQMLCTIDLPDYYEEDRRNELNKVGNNYIWQIPNLADTTLDLLYGILRFLAITLIVAQINWWIVPLIALFLVPTLLAESKMAKLRWFVWDQKGDERHIFWGLDWILRKAQGQMEIRSTQASQYLLDKIDSMNHVFYKEQEKQFRNAHKSLVPTKILESAGTAIGAIVVLRQFLTQTISLERYFFLSGALLRVGGALNNIFGTLSRMQETVQFADGYFELIDTKPTNVNKPDAVTLAKNETPEIEFKDVSFTYPGQSDPIFTNLNLTIAPGEHVALVGENGAGKSTLIKLLLRYYTPDSGQILINGINLADIAIESWYDHIATLFQEFNHYPMPIKENVTIGRSNVKPDDKILKEAADFSGVSEFVSKYKHGWETVLDSSFKKGVEPSGGQWQRVALARAFYRQATVIILDEPTSAIDARAEYHIFNNIFEQYQNKSALIVSHRFSTVRRADRIVVLEKGKIIEQGTHKQLMSKNGMYKDLFSKQAEGYR